MLQYLIILLDETSTSFCHYSVPKSRGERPIDIDILKKGIRFGMMENLMIQFVYPEKTLSAKRLEVINTIDHIDIKPNVENKETVSDVLVFNDLPFGLMEKEFPPTVVFRLTFQDFFDFPHFLAKQAFQYFKKLNIVIRDIDPILAWDLDRYQKKLEEISEWIEEEYINGNSPQWNILTDRMMLSKMNNCGAGDTSITLAPNGKFYVCPAFYYEAPEDSIGDLNNGLSIPNQQLYKLEYAPICRHCDAYQCRRCIWLNRRMTKEVNTPSHEQCVAAHIERNVSRQLLHNIRKHDEFMPETDDIKEIDYLDPFNNREQWQQENW